MTNTTTTPSLTMRLNPAALALAFGVAGAVVIVLFGGVVGSAWGMMGGASGGWMHGSMMGGGAGFFVYALVCGFLGGAIAGGVSAWVYNNFAARTA